jgi:uncharacterized membrane protein
MDEAVTQPAANHRPVDSGRGTAWWGESWALFMKNPGMWLVFGVIVVVGMAVLHFIPVIGSLVASLLFQVIAGGWMLSARKLDTGGKLEVGDLFEGFKDKLNPLLVLGAISLGATIVIVLVMATLGGSAVLGLAAGGAYRSTGGLMAGAALGMLAVLIGLGLGFLFAMALWFAPALVVFRGVAPVDALKASWAASLGNIVPFLVYGVIWIVAAVIASIPLGLGWLVLMPLTALGMYCSYQDIFEGQSAA